MPIGTENAQKILINQNKLKMENEIKKVVNFGWALQGDRIAVKRVDDEKISKGGIIIPDTAVEKANEGLIVGLGEDILYNEQGLKRANCNYFINQRIKFGKYAGSEITGDDGEEYIIMREHDILAYKPK